MEIMSYEIRRIHAKNAKITQRSQRGDCRGRLKCLPVEKAFVSERHHLINPRLQSGDSGTSTLRRPVGTVFVPSLRDGDGRCVFIHRLKSGVNQMLSHAGQEGMPNFVLGTLTGCSSYALTASLQSDSIVGVECIAGEYE